MAILFDWYENPKTSEQQGEENMLHPRLRLNGKVSTGPAPCPYTEILYIDGNGCNSRARCAVTRHGRGIGGRQAGASGRHRLFPSQSGEHRAGNRKDET